MSALVGVLGSPIGGVGDGPVGPFWRVCRGLIWVRLFSRTRARFGWGRAPRIGTHRRPTTPATRRNTPAFQSLCVQSVASAGWVHVPIRRQPQPPRSFATRDGAKPSIHDANTPNGEKTTRPSALNRSAARRNAITPEEPHPCLISSHACRYLMVAFAVSTRLVVRRRGNSSCDYTHSPCSRAPTPQPTPSEGNEGWRQSRQPRSTVGPRTRLTMVTSTNDGVEGRSGLP